MWSVPKSPVRLTPAWLWAVETLTRIPYPAWMGGRLRRRVRNPLARLAAARTHHSDHRPLLASAAPAAARAAELDALIVPTARPVSWTREAIALAKNLRCTLVALCSRRNSARDVTHLAEEQSVPALALDMRDCHLTVAGTSSAELVDGGNFYRDSDVGEKRNLGLLLSRIAGWKRVLFLDDDIYDVNPGHARAAAGLLDRYAAVSLQNVGFPDNSVVCHAFRMVGGPQEQFIGAGAMAVAPTRTRSFFPVNYNDDWLYLLGDAQPPRVAMTGSMRQKKFDPFATAERARSEEFGDSLAEGLFWLLDDHLPLERADDEYWQSFLHRRARFIERLLARVRRVIEDSDLRTRMVGSLTEARETHKAIGPELCSEYVRRWRSDLEAWQRRIDDTPVGLGIDQALVHLGLSDVVHRS